MILLQSLKSSALHPRPLWVGQTHMSFTFKIYASLWRLAATDWSLATVSNVSVKYAYEKKKKLKALASSIGMATASKR